MSLIDRVLDLPATRDKADVQARGADGDLHVRPAGGLSSIIVATSPRVLRLAEVDDGRLGGAVGDFDAAQGDARPFAADRPAACRRSVRD